MRVKTGLGQDSHAFEDSDKALILGGVEFDHPQALSGNSDADVVLHAITNAISSISGQNILGKVADELCQAGIVDSREYLKVALADLGDWRIEHVAISIECLVPKISPNIDAMKRSIAQLLDIETADVGITATTGEGLSAFGQGKGIQAFCLMTVSQ